MRLNDDKINHLAHLITNKLKETGKVSFLKSKNDIRLKIREIITTELYLDDEIENISRSKIPKKIQEGSRQWDVLYEKYFQEEMAKRGRF